jgi:ATP-dependent DNA helicase PIF1
MYDHSLDLEFITGLVTGERILLPKIDLTLLDCTLPFSFTRCQYPIRIAFAMKINKAKDQTLDKVGLYLSQSVFNHGQIYVAMSSVGSFKILKIQIILINKKESMNIVYKEII